MLLDPQFALTKVTEIGWRWLKTARCMLALSRFLAGGRNFSDARLDKVGASDCIDHRAKVYDCSVAHQFDNAPIVACQAGGDDRAAELF